VKSAILLCLLLLAFAPANGAGKKPMLFAMLTQDTPVQLEDGAKWMMDKGDAFPVVMFKEQQTKLVLQLAGTTFLIPAANVRVLDEKELTEEVLAAYRRNVASYIDGKSRKWQAAAKGMPEE
jgi:hypothetical protein